MVYCILYVYVEYKYQNGAVFPIRQTKCFSFKKRCIIRGNKMQLFERDFIDAGVFAVISHLLRLTRPFNKYIFT